MAFFDSPKSYLGAHVVTRPNPNVVGVNRDGRCTLDDLTDRYASQIGERKPHSMYFAKSKPPKVLFQSFSDAYQTGPSLVSYKNGLVNGIIRAFQQDLHLVLRPDDVWLAIMVQFSFYVNGHAEKMRRFFVAHEGKKGLVVNTGPISPLSVDFSKIAQAFRELIQENVVDPDLTSWILPNFSTTTSEDITTTTIVMMATTKAYFTYSAMGGCGFPSVTLLGERADWVELLEKVAKLATYNAELADWSKLLTKVVDKMIETVDQPDLQSTKDFWMRAVHEAGEGGSMDIKTLSGWVTAFCYWSERGYAIDQIGDEDIPMTARHVDRKRLIIDDVPFPMIRFGSIPRAVAEVPVKFVDLEADICYQTTAVAGLVGAKPSASTEGGPRDTLQPCSGYWIFVDETGPIPADLRSGAGYASKRA